MRRLKQQDASLNGDAPYRVDPIYTAFIQLSKNTIKYGTAIYWWGVFFLAIGLFLWAAPMIGTALSQNFLNGFSGQFSVSGLAESDVFRAAEPLAVFKAKIVTAFEQGQQILFEPLLLALLVAIVAYVFLRIPVRAVLSPWRRLSFYRFGLAFVLCSIAIALLWAGYALFGIALLQFNGDLARGTILLILLPIIFLQTLAEEFVFRGFVLRACVLVSQSPFVAAILSACIFAALHLIRPDILENPAILVALFMFGFFWSLLTLRSRGIEYALGLHFAVNYSSLAILSSVEHGDGAVLYTLQGDANIQMWMVLCIAVVTFFLYQYETYKMSK